MSVLHHLSNTGTSGTEARFLSDCDEPRQPHMWLLLKGAKVGQEPPCPTSRPHRFLKSLNSLPAILGKYLVRAICLRISRVAKTGMAGLLPPGLPRVPVSGQPCYSTAGQLQAITSPHSLPWEVYKDYEKKKKVLC